MTSPGQVYVYDDAGAACEGWIAFDPDAGPRPCVIYLHDWSGRLPHMDAMAEAAAQQGYVGFAADIYGAGRRGEVAADNSALIGPWLTDRSVLRQRLLAILEAARRHPAVDPRKIVVQGYCFGGLCALDLARSGADIRGAISIHGVFDPPGPSEPIRASVLVLHGWEDPMATPPSVIALTEELTGAGADWQLHAYGHALHAFSAEGLFIPERGIAYDPKAAARAQWAVQAFLHEMFA